MRQPPKPAGRGKVKFKAEVQKGELSVKREGIKENTVVNDETNIINLVKTRYFSATFYMPLAELSIGRVSRYNTIQSGLLQ
jgi:hypothetical protein